MRIAFIVNNFPPRSGGVELHVQALARELSKLGHEAVVVTLGAPTGWRIEENVRILTLPEHSRIGGILGFPGIGTTRRLKKLLRTEAIDIVSVHTRFFPMSFVGLLAATRSGIPVVHTEHGSGHVASDSFVIRFASKMVDFTIGKYVLRNATRVLSVSEESAQFVKQLAGVDAHVFFNAIDAPESPPNTWRNQAGLLSFVGRLVPGKGWEVFLDVLQGLRRSGIQVRGEIIGDGPDMPALQARIAQMNLESSVRVRGRIQQQQVRESLRGATLVNPTTLSEGFQTTLLEALAEGGRIFTYPVPGSQALQEQGAPVHISSEKSPTALSTLLAKEVNRPWRAMSKQQIQQWTWDVRAQEFADLCKQLLTRR